MELMQKFYKEGWHIDLLSERAVQSRLPGEVEQYVFAYASASVQELIESCTPQLVIFAGAYDVWAQENKEANATETGAFIAGLNNILVSAGKAGVAQFAYLSSNAVFETPSARDIPEDAELTPKTPAGLRIAQGETVAAAFGRYSEMEVTVIRVGDLFCIPRSQEECVDRYTQLCLSALLTGTVTVNAKRISAPLFVSDAVFAIYLILTGEKRGAPVYHLAASEEADEEDVAQAIRRTFSKPVTIVDQTTGVTDRRVLSAALAAQEFQITPRMGYERAIAIIVAYMEEHRKNYGVLKKRGLKDRLKRARTSLGSAFPFLECIAYFLLAFFLNSLRGEIALFKQVDFFLLYVFLFAIMRGRTMAIVAFCLAVFGHYLALSQTQSLLGLLISVDSYVWIVQVFVIGIFTGYLRDKLTLSRQEGLENERYLQARLDEMTAINASNAKIKNHYAARIVNSDESVGWFYDVITELDNAENGEVVFRAVQLLKRLMGTEHVAVYTMNGAAYCRLSAATSTRATELGKSIHIPSHPELFEPLLSKNYYFNPEIVSDLPSMASSLVGEKGDDRLFIFLWDMPFDRKNLHYSNLLKVVGTLIYNATARSARYMDALAYKRFVPDTQLLTKDAFAEMAGVYQKVAEMGLTQFHMLKIKLGPDVSLQEMDRKIHECIRQTDFVGMLKKKKIGLLLPNSTEIDGQVVKDRLQAAGITAKTYDPDKLLKVAADGETAVPGSGVPFKERLENLTQPQKEDVSDNRVA